VHFSVGDEVAIDSCWKLRTSGASRTRRVGLVIEVIGEGTRTRYRIKWHNHGGGESIYRPVGESMHSASDRKDPGFATS
jgi:hypothetical protein